MLLIHIVSLQFTDSGAIIGLIFIYPAAVIVGVIPGARFARQRHGLARGTLGPGLLAGLLGHVPALCVMSAAIIATDLSIGDRILSAVLLTTGPAIAGGLIGDTMGANNSQR